MGGGQFTKKAVAGAMKSIMKEKPFGEITVDEITKRSGVSHKTFYYHFKDKYDVVNWIFQTEVMGDILSHTTLAHWEEGSVTLCDHIRENPEFYINAVRVEGQNSLREYLHKLTEAQVGVLCREACGEKELPPENLAFLVDFYYGAFIELFTAWVRSGMKESTETLVENWKVLVDKSLENYVNFYAR